MISERLGRWVRHYMLYVGEWLSRIGMTPNMATLIGLFLNVGVAAVIASGHPRWGGFLLLIASAFDMVDGAIARATNNTTKFGGFFDSTIDRYSEVVIYVGLLIWLNQTDDAQIGSVLILLAVTGSMLISYARSRAESLGYGASVGIAARPERVVLLALFLLINQPLWALWILAIVTHVTAVTRIVHVYRQTRAEDA